MSSVATTMSVVSSSREASRLRFAGIGLATVAAAVIANILVYYIGDALIGYDHDFVVLATVGGTIFFTLTAAIVAVLVYAAVLRLSQNPARVYSIIATVVFVVTLIPDFTYIPTVEAATAAQTAILVLMHAVAAAVIVPMLTTLARPHAR